MQRTLAGESFPVIQDIRHHGLFCAVDLDPQMVDVMEVIKTAAEKHELIIMSCGKSSLRIIPPLVIERKELDFFFDKLELTLREFMPK